YNKKLQTRNYRKAVEHGDTQTVHFRPPAGQGALADRPLRVPGGHDPDQSRAMAAGQGRREAGAAGRHAGTAAGAARDAGESAILRYSQDDPPDGPPHGRTATATGEPQRVAL